MLCPVHIPPEAAGESAPAAAWPTCSEPDRPPGSCQFLREALRQHIVVEGEAIPTGKGVHRIAVAALEIFPSGGDPDTEPFEAREDFPPRESHRIETEPTRLFPDSDGLSARKRASGKRRVAMT